MISKIKLFLIKPKIAKVIYRIETHSASMGISSAELSSKYARELKKNPAIAREISAISRKLYSNYPKDEVYKKFLDGDIVILIREALKNQIPLHTLFKEFSEHKEKAEKIIRGVKSKMIFPFLVFIAIVFALNTTMGNFVHISESVQQIKFSAINTFFMKNFLIFNLSYGIAFFAYINFFPKFVPLLRTIFIKINGMMALSTIKVMDSMSFSARDILKTIIAQFSIKNQAKIAKNEDGLLTLLNDEKFIDPIQLAEIKISLERGELINGVNTVLKEKIEEVDNLENQVSSAMATISILLLVPPISIMVSVFINLMLSSGSMAQ